MTANSADLDPRRIETLRAIMKALRTPVTGCPWDLEQNFETIAPYTIEEAYEVADAIASPGLTRAVKLQAKAAKVGFDWPSVDNVYDKIAEEVEEFRVAPPEKREEEYGDILFAMANVARHLGIDPEAALRGANTKFAR